MYLKTMTEEQIQNTLEEHGISAAELKSMVLILKEWLKQQHHLPQYMNEQQLQCYLWSNKCSLEKTKQKLDAYFTMRDLIPEVFANRDPCTKEMMLDRKTINIFPLPRLTKDGCRVIYSRVSPTSSASDYNQLTNCRSLVKVADYLMANETLSNGTYIICDVKSLTPMYAKNLQVALLKKMVKLHNETAPLRFTKIIIFNYSSHLNFILTLVFSLLPNKIQEQIHHFTGDHTVLYKYINKEILPKEYGGEEASIDELNDAWEKTIESFKDWLMNEGSQLTDESKRPEKSKYTYSDFFGVEGSFRQLTID